MVRRQSLVLKLSILQKLIKLVLLEIANIFFFEIKKTKILLKNSSKLIIHINITFIFSYPITFYFIREFYRQNIFSKNSDNN